MQNKYKLGFCEIFHPSIHGITNNSSPYILTHYIIISTICKSDFFNNRYINQCINGIYRSYTPILNAHPIIRNYNNIISDKNNIKIEIIQIIKMPGNEYTAIIKTIWLKILQRKWKKYYKNLILKLVKSKNIYNLRKREITGKL